MSQQIYIKNLRHEWKIYMNENSNLNIKDKTKKNFN